MLSFLFKSISKSVLHSLDWVEGIVSFLEYLSNYSFAKYAEIHVCLCF